MVHGLNEADDVYHGAVRHGGGDVTRHGVRQSGMDVRLRQFLLPCPLAVQNVAKALNHDVSVAQHVG